MHPQALTNTQIDERTQAQIPFVMIAKNARTAGADVVDP